VCKNGECIDIVDAQLHIGPGMIDPTLEAMNSICITSLLLEEYWDLVRPTKAGQIEPGYFLPNGAWRAIYPVAQLASALHPDRFSFFVRIDRNDPQLESVMRVIASSPQARGFRLLGTWRLEEAEAFINGDFEAVLDIAQDIGLPVCFTIGGYVEHLPRYLKRFSRLSVVVDHWGMGLANLPKGRSDAEMRRAMSVDYLDEVMRLAEHPNVALKISHGTMFFGTTQYPYEPLRPIVRRAIQAFGADRLVWAGDKTANRPLLSWSDLVHSLRDDPEISLEEKEWILGRSARRIFKWPAAATHLAGSPTLDK
jgi:predicted TIM-barrel fold metal-dependent hydrolase